MLDTKTNEKTIAQLVEEIYEDNFSHIDFMDKMYNKIQKGVRFYQVISSVYGRPGL